MITAISFVKKIKDIKNYRDLPAEIQSEISKVERIESNGFQELIGYNGRQAIFSIGGHWIDENEDKPSFTATNYGSRNFQWSNSEELHKSVAAWLIVKFVHQEDAREIIRRIESQLNRFQFRGNSYIGFMANQNLNQKIKEIKFPLPNLFPKDELNDRLLAKVKEVIDGSWPGSVTAKIELER